jgi:transposase
LNIDNARVHQSRFVIKCLEDDNINYLFLPPYSPELNPIELAWSKIKLFVKKRKPRTKSCLCFSILKAVCLINKKDALGYYRHSNAFLAI